MVKGRRLDAIPGAPPDLANLPPGRPFAPRCTLADAGCGTGQVTIEDLSDSHMARCRRVALTAPPASGTERGAGSGRGRRPMRRRIARDVARLVARPGIGAGLGGAVAAAGQRLGQPHRGVDPVDDRHPGPG